MWIIKFFSVLLISQAINCATLTCTWNGNACEKKVLSSITLKNEPITVLNAPFTPFSDNITTNVGFQPFYPDPVYSAAHNGISEFPTAIFDIFLNLTYFALTNASMSDLHTDAIHNCPNLETFQFFSTYFGKISARVAGTCSRVTYIFMSNCKINLLDENALEGLAGLERITFRICGLTCLPPKFFQHNKNITYLNFEGNFITALDSRIFVGLTKLDQAFFMYNQISYIPNFDLSTTGTSVASTVFLFSMCPVQAVNPNLLSTLANSGRLAGSAHAVVIDFVLGFVPNCIDPNAVSAITGNPYRIGSIIDWSLHNNFFQTHSTCYSAWTSDMASDLLAACPLPSTTSTTQTTSTVGSNFGQCATDKICRYYLDWNDQYTCVIDGADGTVTSISGSHYLTFTDLDLTRLYFVNSFLSLVPKIIFQKFPNLKYLHVADCDLNVIDDKTFNECGNLEFLDASNNQIERFVETSLRNCTKLKLIDLTGNPIDHIDNGLYQFDPALERIHLRRLSDWKLA